MALEPPQPSPIAPEPNKAEPNKAEPNKAEPTQSTAFLGALPKSPEDATQWLEQADRFVKLVAENLRYGSWTRRFVTIGVVVFVGLNPILAGKVGEIIDKKLPRWYSTAFVQVLAGIAVLAVGAAVITLPKRRSLEIIPERQAIKGLRSFEEKDAEIFKRLERQKDVQECLDTLQDPELRLAFLMGESGAGKSSLLQAGLMPRLPEAKFQGVYVKLGDRDPITLIRRALKASEEEFVPMLANAVTRAGQPIVLILDQFEQFFVQFQETQRSPFIEALKAWYTSDLPVKILIGIRGDLSDRLVELQKALGYTVRPTQVYRLEKFTPVQTTAVLRVIAETENLAFNAPFVLEVARDELAGRDGRISPVEVQILAWTISRETDATNRAFDRLAFQKLGGVDGLLGRSLTRSLKQILSKSQRDRTLEILLALTDLEQNVRSGAFSVAQLQAMPDKVRGEPTEVEEVVQWLREARLITPVEQEGTVAYELAHERLIPALRQVANQELSEANRANLLLDRRVNEWLGSSKGDRYLFSLKELRLLRQQRGFLVWGQREAQKRELVRRSWRRELRNLAGLSLPLLMGAGFGLWSYTPPGQIQWTRWQFMDLDRSLNLESTFPKYSNSDPQDTFIFLALDAVETGHWFPLTYLGWEAPTSDVMGESLAKTAALLGDQPNQPHTRQLLSQTLKVAQANRDPGAKANALISIAEAYLKLNDSSQAKAILSDALTIAKSLQEEDDKAKALSGIAEAYGKLNDNTQAKAILSDALTIAKSLDEYSKANALSNIAEAASKLNDSTQAKAILSDALTIAKSLQDPRTQANILRVSGVVYPTNVLISIAEAYGNLNDSTQAKAILSDALTIAKSIQDEDNQADALINIAEAYGKLNDSTQAKAILSDTLTIAKSFQEEYSKAIALINIAEAASKLNDSRQAKAILSDALTIAKSIQEQYSKASVLSNIAEAYGKLNDNPQAKAILSDALTIAKSIQDEDNQASVLSNIAEAYGKLNDNPQAKAILSDALTIAKSIQDEDNQADALINIAEAYGKLNDSTQAKAILSDALTIAKSIPEEYAKANALSSITRAYLKLKDSDKRELFTTLDHFVEETGEMSSSARGFIGIAYAELGNWGKALRVAQGCDGDDKARVLARILLVHAEQQNPEFKALRDNANQDNE